MSPNPAYPCVSYVQTLTPVIRERARVLFASLAEHGRIDSVEVAAILECERKEIGACLTRSLRNRAEALDLPLPYDGGRGEEPYGGISNPRASDDPGRTYYQDREGIAQAMIDALG